MYAIIVCGGKQYKVSAGDTLKVELLKKTEVGAVVELDVLMVNNDGQVIAGDACKAYKAKAEVVSIGKGPKLNIFTYKAKKNIRKRQGHRQPYSEIKVLEIVG